MSTFTERPDHVTESGSGHTPTPTDRHHGDGSSGRGMLIGLVVVLAAAVVGLGAWLIVDGTETSDTAVTDEVQQLLDDYHDAWNEYDGDAYLRLMTPGGMHVVGGRATQAAQQATIIEGLDRYDWHVEPIGEPILVGDGPWYVAQANLLTATTYPEGGHEGLSVLTIVNDDGTMRITRHVYTGRS